jgi:hypothetical protein
MRTRLLLSVSLVSSCLLAACGDSEPADKGPLKSAPNETKIEVTPKPAESPDPKREDPFADDVWEDDGADTDAAVAPPAVPPEPGAWPGPCKITYKNGPTLRFKYTATGGTVRIDANVEGVPDTCGKFDRKDGRTTKVSVDLGCDKQTDLRIEPKYEADVNIATAKVTASEENGGNREITLVTLGTFVGLEPGYPLQAARKDVKLDVKDGKVSKASIAGDAPARLDIAYDDKGRIKTLKEDLGADGSIDRKFDYRFDKIGNVERIDVAVTPAAVEGGPKPKTVKQTAKLDYSCWAKPAK